MKLGTIVRDTNQLVLGILESGLITNQDRDIVLLALDHIDLDDPKLAPRERALLQHFLLQHTQEIRAHQDKDALTEPSPGGSDHTGP